MSKTLGLNEQPKKRKAKLTKFGEWFVKQPFKARKYIRDEITKSCFLDLQRKTFDKEIEKKQKIAAARRLENYKYEKSGSPAPVVKMYMYEVAVKCGFNGELTDLWPKFYKF